MPDPPGTERADDHPPARLRRSTATQGALASGALLSPSDGPASHRKPTPRRPHSPYLERRGVVRPQHASPLPSLLRRQGASPHNAAARLSPTPRERSVSMLPCPEPSLLVLEPLRSGSISGIHGELSYSRPRPPAISGVYPPTLETAVKTQQEDGGGWLGGVQRGDQRLCAESLGRNGALCSGGNSGARAQERHLCEPRSHTPTAPIGVNHPCISRLHAAQCCTLVAQWEACSEEG